MTRNTDPKPTTYAEWEDLEEERDSLRADRDRLASELSQVRGELERTKRNHLRRMAQSALHREMWCKRRIVVHWDVMHRGGTRLASLQTAIRAALAELEGGAK